MYLNQALRYMLPLYFISCALYAESEDPGDQNTNQVQFSGFIDSSYNYLQQSNKFTSGVYNRVYDLNEGGVTLQQAAGTASYLPDSGFGALLNAMVGRDAITSNAYGMGVWTDSPDFGVDVTQAFLRYSQSSSFYIDAGKFTTLNGAETIAPITDTNFSRAMLFGYAGPFTALGLRSTYIANKQLKVYLGLNDGWDTIRDFSRGPTLELGSNYAFTPKFSLGSTLYLGKQRIVDRTALGR